MQAESFDELPATPEVGPVPAVDLSQANEALAGVNLGAISDAARTTAVSAGISVPDVPGMPPLEGAGLGDVAVFTDDDEDGETPPAGFCGLLLAASLSGDLPHTVSVWDGDTKRRRATEARAP